MRAQTLCRPLTCRLGPAFLRLPEPISAAGQGSAEMTVRAGVAPGPVSSQLPLPSGGF